MSVACNNENDLAFWCSVHVKYETIWWVPCGRNLFQFLRTSATSQTETARRRCWNILCDIGSPSPPPSHFILFLFSYIRQDSYWEYRRRFSILRRSEKKISVKAPSTSNIFPIKLHEHYKKKREKKMWGVRVWEGFKYFRQRERLKINWRKNDSVNKII
jgi:hypothetical protein